MRRCLQLPSNLHTGLQPLQQRTIAVRLGACLAERQLQAAAHPGYCAGAEEDDLQGGRAHTRGKATYVFVTWDHIQDSPLNLPVDKMDFYVPG